MWAGAGVPDIRYADSDGLSIAYQVFGDGPVDVVVVPGFISHIEHAWAQPQLAGFLRQLAGFARVICFDKRGMGLSDRNARDETPSMSQRCSDVLAVMGAAGSSSAAVLAWSEGGPTAISFCHEHPDRAAALILIATTARFTTEADYSQGIPLAVLEVFIETLRSEWGTGVGFELHAPSVADDARLRAWWASYQRLASTPGAVEASLRMHLDVDVRKLLRTLDLPSLVVHQKFDMVVPVECGRYLAENLAGAFYLEREGQDHLFWLGDQQETLRGIRTVLSRVPGASKLISRTRAQRPARFGWESITSAELSVVELVALGLTNRQIGERLHLSPRTVQTHITHVLAKLSLGGRAELAVEVARRSG